MEGPRPLHAGEIPSLARLLNRTFRAKAAGEMLAEYPHIVNETNLRRLIVICDGGEVVSNVGTRGQQIVFEEAALSVALVGGVATAAECRGRGYATRCLDFALDQAARDGDDLAWISGGRGLYTSRGAATAGRERVYPVAAGPDAPASLAIREFSPGDYSAAAALYEREPVRFVRDGGDWARVAKNRFVMNAKSRFWAVIKADSLSAYLILHEPREGHPASLLAEFAGDRMDAARALPQAAWRTGAALVQAHVGDWDRAGCEGFAAIASAEPKLEAGRGTFLPLRMAACLEKLRPRIARLCGEGVAADLRFSESGDGPGSRSGTDARLHIALGPDEARILGRAEVARFLFGAPEPRPPAFEGTPSVIEKLQPALPLPTPWYGMNFV